MRLPTNSPTVFLLGSTNLFCATSVRRCDSFVCASFLVPCTVSNWLRRAPVVGSRSSSYLMRHEFSPRRVMLPLMTFLPSIFGRHAARGISANSIPPCCAAPYQPRTQTTRGSRAACSVGAVRRSRGPGKIAGRSHHVTMPGRKTSSAGHLILTRG